MGTDPLFDEQASRPEGAAASSAVRPFTGRNSRPAAARVGWAAVHRLAVEQHGAFSLRQAVARGIPVRSVRDRLERDGYARPHRGVALLPDTRSTGHTRAFASTLALGQRAVLTGQPALAVHGLLVATGLRPHVVCHADVRLTAPQGIRLVRSRTLAPLHWSLVGEVRVATPLRAFLDLAPHIGRDRIRALLVDARQQGLVDPAALIAVVAEMQRLHGRERLLGACEAVLGSGADSPLVLEVEGWLKRKGFHLDVAPRTVPTRTRVLHPDITLVGLPVGIEVDGFGYHASRSALDLDQRKHNAYLLAGWIVLRITWDRLRQDPAGFLAELRAAVAQVEGR